MGRVLGDGILGRGGMSSTCGANVVRVPKKVEMRARVEVDTTYGSSASMHYIVDIEATSSMRSACCRRRLESWARVQRRYQGERVNLHVGRTLTSVDVDTQVFDC